MTIKDYYDAIRDIDRLAAFSGGTHYEKRRYAK